MGVHGLWKLLSPAARTVSIESLRNKTLAIDISIWMVQFIKAMRNEQVSEQVRLTVSWVSERVRENERGLSETV